MALPRYIPHYTVEDYRQWKGDWELWSGVAVAMSPSAKRAPQRLCGRLFRLFSDRLESAGCEECEVLFETDWIVGSDTVFRPALAIVCHHPPSDFIEKTPTLVVEVLSDSIRQRDLVHKREVYEELGVKYYLTADPADESVRFLVLGEQSRYEEYRGREVELHGGCRFTISLDKLF